MNDTKLATSVLLLCLALSLQPISSRAQAVVPAALATAIAQLDTDLLAIPAGSTVTDAQHQAIVADLNALAVGIVPAPDADDIDFAATRLGDAATAGNVTADSLAELNGDLVDDATDADDWMEDILDDAYVLLHPYNTDPEPFPIDPNDPGDGGDPNWPIETGIPVYATSVLPHFITRSHSSHTFTLDMVNVPTPLLQYFYGRVELHTQQLAGRAAKSAVYVRTAGLPLNNPYTVSITRKSDGVTVTLGKLRVHSVPLGRVFILIPGNAPKFSSRAEIASAGRVVFGGKGSKSALPADFDPVDVATVALTDSQGIVRVSGNVDTASDSVRNRAVLVRLSGSPALAPTAFANATVQHKVFPTLQSDRFHFSARHLPANVEVTLLIDGTPVGQFLTTGHGRLVVVTEGKSPVAHNRSGGRVTTKALPAGVDLSNVKSLSLTDAQGNVLANGSL